MTQASEPLQALDFVAAIWHSCSLATLKVGNALASLKFANFCTLDCIVLNIVKTSTACKCCHFAGNINTRAHISMQHSRSNSHSARVPAEFGHPRFFTPMVYGTFATNAPQVLPSSPMQFTNAVRQPVAMHQNFVRLWRLASRSPSFTKS